MNRPELYYKNYNAAMWLVAILVVVSVVSLCLLAFWIVATSNYSLSGEIVDKIHSQSEFTVRSGEIDVPIPIITYKFLIDVDDSDERVWITISEKEYYEFDIGDEVVVDEDGVILALKEKYYDD